MSVQSSLRFETDSAQSLFIFSFQTTDPCKQSRVRRNYLAKFETAVRLNHYSYRTEQIYVQWIRRYILFHRKRHPQEMGISDIEAFLTHLVV